MCVLRSIACGYGCALSLVPPQMLHNPDIDLEIYRYRYGNENNKEMIDQIYIFQGNFRTFNRIIQEGIHCKSQLSLVRFSSLLYRLMERRFSSTLNKVQQGFETWRSTGPCGLEELAKIIQALWLEGTCIYYHGLLHCHFFKCSLALRHNNLPPFLKSFDWVNVFSQCLLADLFSEACRKLANHPCPLASYPWISSSGDIKLLFGFYIEPRSGLVLFSGIAPAAGNIQRHNIDGVEEVPAVLHHWSSGGNAAQLMPCFQHVHLSGSEDDCEED